MGVPFGEWIHKVIATHTEVSIGEGENKIVGAIVAYDEHHAVVTFEAEGMIHYIPLTSIRSFGYEENERRAACDLELFKR